MMQQQKAENAAGQEYWVVGGVYSSTQFSQNPHEERFGPYSSYAEAFSEWSRLAWKTVDDAHARYRIVKGD